MSQQGSMRNVQWRYICLRLPPESSFPFDSNSLLLKHVPTSSYSVFLASADAPKQIKARLHRVVERVVDLLLQCITSKKEK